MTNYYKHSKRTRLHKATGFTLIEALISVGILGFAITALMLVMGSGTRINQFGQQVSTATLLTEETRAIIDNTPFENISTLNGQTLNATDALGNNIAGLEQYSQQVTITYVDPITLQNAAIGDPQIAARVTVATINNGVEIASVSWLRMQ